MSPWRHPWVQSHWFTLESSLHLKSFSSYYYWWTKFEISCPFTSQISLYMKYFFHGATDYLSSPRCRSLTILNYFLSFDWRISRNKRSIWFDCRRTRLILLLPSNDHYGYLFLINNISIIFLLYTICNIHLIGSHIPMRTSLSIDLYWRIGLTFSLLAIYW